MSLTIGDYAKAEKREIIEQHQQNMIDWMNTNSMNQEVHTKFYEEILNCTRYLKTNR